jgi:hypothetical protein
MNLCWNKFLLNENNYYKCLTDNFENYFDEDHIKHFDIKDWDSGYHYDAHELKIKYNDDIQKELIKWIKKEVEEQRLFQKNNWKPFCDRTYIAEMYLGYRKVFQYDDHYFQLGMDYECYVDNCKYCETNPLLFRFLLLVYRPNEPEILESNDFMMPEKDWNYQKYIK